MYIDPNTGGMLFQVLAILFAMTSGVILLFSSKIKMFWARLIRRRSDRSDSQGENSNDEAE